MPNRDNYVKNSEDEHGKHYLNENLVKCMEVLVGTMQMHTPLPTHINAENVHTAQHRRQRHNLLNTTKLKFAQQFYFSISLTVVCFRKLYTICIK